MDNLAVFEASMKIIKSVVKCSTDILVYLEEEKILKNTILDVFGDASAAVQCRIACLHLDNSIRWAGEYVMEELAKSGDHCLQGFFTLLCKQLFPASKTSLSERKSALCQGESSIVEYAKELRILVEGMGTSVDHYGVRWSFVKGLNEGVVRAVLRMHPFEGKSFEALVSHAAEVEINMSCEEVEVVGGMIRLEQDSGVKVSSEEGGVENKKQVKGPILSPKYFKMAREKGLGPGKCYNCLTGFHSCYSCPRIKCKFCGKKLGQTGHFSLLCPLSPAKL